MIEDIHNKEDFEKSVRFFHTFDGALTGATDIDLCYERHGHILFIEGKKIRNGIIAIKKGQLIALQALNKKQDVHVCIVGEGIDLFAIPYYYICRIQSLHYVDDLFDMAYCLADIGKEQRRLSLQELKDYIKDIVKDW